MKSQRQLGFSHMVAMTSKFKWRSGNRNESESMEETVEESPYYADSEPVSKTQVARQHTSDEVVVADTDWH